MLAACLLHVPEQQEIWFCRNCHYAVPRSVGDAAESQTRAIFRALPLTTNSAFAMQE